MHVKRGLWFEDLFPSDLSEIGYLSSLDKVLPDNIEDAKSIFGRLRALRTGSDVAKHRIVLDNWNVVALKIRTIIRSRWERITKNVQICPSPLLASLHPIGSVGSSCSQPFSPPLPTQMSIFDSWLSTTNCFWIHTYVVYIVVAYMYPSYQGGKGVNQAYLSNLQLVN